MIDISVLIELLEDSCNRGLEKNEECGTVNC